MIFTVEQVKALKEVDNSLLEFIENELCDKCGSYDESNNVEDLTFEYEGIEYHFDKISQDEWIDDGKYQYTSIYYQLVNNSDKFNVVIELSVIRSRSYFSDYYYTYDNPKVLIASIVQIPEKIIPAHEEVLIK